MTANHLSATNVVYESLCAIIIIVERRAFFRPREDFRRVGHRFAKGLALIMNASTLPDLSPTRVTLSLVLSRGRRNTLAEATIIRAFSQSLDETSSLDSERTEPFKNSLLVLI